MSPRNATKQALQEYGDLFLPEEAAEPILATPVRGALMQWLQEVWCEKALLALDVKPRRKAMFSGPPGVGKTTLAHHLAARLGLPMLAVRPDRIIDCWVGSSNKNIGGLFEAAAAAGSPLVLFLDEMDAIAAKRTEVRQGADQARNEMVNTLLQRMEQHAGFLIAATNHPDRIDPAVWRRFEIHISLELPGHDECVQILKRYLAPLGLPKRSLESMATAMEGASPALIRSFCENLKRQIVVGPELKLDMSAAAVVDRLVASCQPHPDLGKPRLWGLGGADKAVAAMPWPLPTARQVRDGQDEQDALSADPEASGRLAFETGQPVTANPYVFGDDRRRQFDAAWRAASGSDGMGPSAGGAVVDFRGRK